MVHGPWSMPPLSGCLLSAVCFPAHPPPLGKQLVEAQVEAEGVIDARPPAERVLGLEVAASVLPAGQAEIAFVG